MAQRDEADHSTAIHVGEGGRIGDITVEGDVAGRDIIKITEELAYDVSDLGHNPYLGLASYTYATRAFYGGREPQIRDAVARLTAPGDEPVVLFVTGASGSGKSSLVQAGLLPALEDAYTTRGRQVCWSVMRPGRHPIDALAQVLGELGFSEPPDGDWTALLRTPKDLNLLLATQSPPKQINVLILDQFEELFTQAELAERDTTCGLLSGLDTFEHVHTHVIATLRADYLPALFGVPALFERAKQDGIELRAMSSEELARAIRRPIQEQARLEGKDKRLDPALAERLVEDVRSDPALLPLLQVTLRALWDEPPHRLILDRYQSLTSALEQQANQLIDHDRQGHERSQAEREQLMGILLDLVEVSLDDDPHRDVRRALPKQDVLQGHPERTGLIEELVNARLIIAWVEQRGQTSVEMIDIIHETLLDSWPRLREAIAAQREALQQRERFRLALREWLQSGRSDQYMLQGVRLAEARSLSEDNDVALRDPEGRTFLEQSNSAEGEARTRRQRILAGAAGLAVVLAAAALVAAGFAFSAQRIAEEQTSVAKQQARIATSRQLTSQAELARASSPALLPTSVALVTEAARRSPSVETMEVLRSGLTLLPRMVFAVNHTNDVVALAFSQDGRYLASGSWDATAAITDTESGHEVARVSHSGTAHAPRVMDVAFSPDARYLATASLDGTAGVWEVQSGREITRLKQDAQVVAVNFSPDGTHVATASLDGTAQVWSTTTWSKTAPPMTHGGWVNSVSFNQDGTLLTTASEDNTARVWDVGTARELSRMTHDGPVRVAVFSEDGSHLATASADNTARVWDASTQQEVARMTHGGPVNAVRFNPDGTSVASASDDGTARIWEVNTGREMVRMTHASKVHAVSFNRDGTLLATASDDQTARVWDASSGDEVGRMTNAAAVQTAAFSPDGTHLATAGGDVCRGSECTAQAQLWEVTGLREITSLKPVPGPIREPVFSGDQRYVAADTTDDTRIWDLTTGQSVALPHQHGPPDSVGLSPDGSHVVTVKNGLVDVWQTSDGSLIGSLANEGVPDFVGFSWEGQLLELVVGNKARLWALGTRSDVATMPVDTASRPAAIAFSPDAAYLAMATFDKAARVWEVRSGRELARITLDDVARAIAFSPDGMLLITAGATSRGTDRVDAHRVVQVWSVADSKEVASLTHTEAAYLSALTPDGRYLATASWDGMAWVWETRTGREIARKNLGSLVHSMAFTADGANVATSIQESSGGRLNTIVQVWQVTNEREVARVINDDGGETVTFSRDGRYLVTAANSGARLSLWRPQDLIDEACSRLPRNLNAAEWGIYLGDEPYHRTCPGLD